MAIKANEFFTALKQDILKRATTFETAIDQIINNREYRCVSEDTIIIDDLEIDGDCVSELEDRYRKAGWIFDYSDAHGAMITLTDLSKGRR